MIKKLYVSTTTALVIAGLLTSCSNNYVSTNLDKNNFNDYFSASVVKIVDSEKDFSGRYQYIGAVEGQDCQVKAHHAAPDKINARTQARQQAFNMDANAVVFSGCAVLEQAQLAQLNSQGSKVSNNAQQCHAIVICYAKAYVIEEAK